MLRVYAKQAEAEAGVVTLEHLDVELSHITLRLTESVLGKIIEYFFTAVSVSSSRSEWASTFLFSIFTCIFVHCKRSAQKIRPRRKKFCLQ